MIIEGKNSVTEALKGGMNPEKVYIRGDLRKAAGEIYALCGEKKIPVYFVGGEALKRLSESGDPRGYLAVASDFEYTDAEELLEKDGDLFLLILDGIEDPRNFGAIIRTAECAGVDGIVIRSRRSCGVTDTAIRTSCGAASYVKIAKVANINDFIRKLKERDVKVFCADPGGKSVYDADLTGDIALVVGNEGKGVRPLTERLCGGTASLPQYGKINSLNASVACGIILYEAVRQRRNL